MWSVAAPIAPNPSYVFVTVETSEYCNIIVNHKETTSGPPPRAVATDSFTSCISRSVSFISKKRTLGFVFSVFILKVYQGLVV